MKESAARRLPAAVATVAFVALTTAGRAQDATSDAVVTWVRRYAVPLRTVEAGHGFDDLRPFAGALRDARIVAMGEATHGTREFFQFKHRMLEYLVTEMGFRIFAIEASSAAARHVIGPYVLGGDGDSARVLDSQGFWTWNTEEVRDMIAWMRRYNRSVPAARRVKFVGFDLQVNATAAQALLDFLRPHAPDRARALGELLQADSARSRGDSAARAKAAADAGDVPARYRELLGWLTLNAGWLATRSSPAAVQGAVEDARLLVQAADVFSRPFGAGAGSFPDRDFYMAENLRRLLEDEPAGTRVAVWAHNGHVATSEYGALHKPMGAWLREWYGPAYYALGFAFGEGAFQSRDQDPAARAALTEFHLGPAPAGSAEWHLARTGLPALVLDLRATPKPPPVLRWLGEEHGMYSVGSMFARAWPDSNYVAPTRLSRVFDGVFFVAATTRARPNPSVANVAARPR